MRQKHFAKIILPLLLLLQLTVSTLVTAEWTKQQSWMVQRENQSFHRGLLQFGFSLDAHQDWVVVGAPASERAFVFQRQVNDCYHYVTDWGGDGTNKFGRTVAVWNHSVVVGQEHRRLFLFGSSESSGTNLDLVNCQRCHSDQSLAFRGNIIVVGTPNDGDEFQGAVQVFFVQRNDENNNNNNNNTNDETATVSAPVKVTAPNVATRNRFGKNVALTDDGRYLFVVSERGGPQNTGLVYIYQVNHHSNHDAPVILHIQTLSAWASGPGNFFGTDIAVSGDGKILLVSDMDYDIVYVFQKRTPEEEDGQSQWHRDKVLTAHNSSDNSFGWTLDVSNDDDLAVVGTKKYYQDPGTVFLFNVTTGEQLQSFQSTENTFGNTVQLTGTTVLIGARENATVHVFDIDACSCESVELTKEGCHCGAASEHVK